MWNLALQVIVLLHGLSSSGVVHLQHVIPVLEFGLEHLKERKKSKYKQNEADVRAAVKPDLALGALQVAGDAGVFGPVQHGADLLAQF